MDTFASTLIQTQYYKGDRRMRRKSGVAEILVQDREIPIDHCHVHLSQVIGSMVATTTDRSNSKSQVPVHSPERAAAYFPLMLLWLIGLTAWRITAVRYSTLGFSGDEAQYWGWAQTLEWGYFTKPPMIAMVIRGAGEVCGQAEWCARSASPIIHALTALIVYMIGRHFGGPRAGFWAGLVYATLPAVALSSAVISTDMPLLLFFAVAIYAFRRVTLTGSIFWTIICGLAIGFGLLAKYAMVYFVLSAMLYCLFTNRARWLLFSPQNLLLSAIAILVVMPNLIWNIDNGWATVGHLGDNANLGEKTSNPREVLDFYAQQFAVFGPITMAVLLWRIIRAPGIPPSEGEKFLLFFVVPALLVITVQAYLSRANANWAATAYVAGSVIVGIWAADLQRRWLAHLSVGLHLVAAAVLTVFFLNLPGIELPVKSDPLRKLRNWDGLAREIKPILSRDPGRIILFDDRKVMAEMLYELRETAFNPVIWDWNGHPENHHELVYGYNPKPSDRVLLLANWPNPETIHGKFTRSRPLGDIRVPIGAGRERVLKIFEMDGYKGE